MTTFVAGVEYATEICCNCGIPFAMTMDFQRRRRDDHEWFYCPAGHPQHYTGPSETERLRKEVERKTELLEAEQARAARIATERDQVANAHHRMRVRVFNGVCPCCNRTFQNLLAHMQSEHAGQLDLKTVRTAFGMTQGNVAQEIGVPAPYVSSYERGRPVPARAKQAITSWLERQGARERE